MQSVTQKKTYTTCPLCGMKFNKDGACCQGCAANSKCISLRCPHCQYEFVEDSIIWNVLTRFWNKFSSKTLTTPPHLQDVTGVLPLSVKTPGETYEISHLSSDDPIRVDRLVSQGILPGNNITLVQKKPSIIIQVGETEFALDREIADGIFVKKC